MSQVDNRWGNASFSHSFVWRVNNKLIHSYGDLCAVRCVCETPPFMFWVRYKKFKLGIATLRLLRRLFPDPHWPPHRNMLVSIFHIMRLDVIHVFQTLMPVCTTGLKWQPDDIITTSSSFFFPQTVSKFPLKASVTVGLLTFFLLMRGIHIWF